MRIFDGNVYRDATTEEESEIRQEIESLAEPSVTTEERVSALEEAMLALLEA